MHPTADTLLVIFDNLAGRRVMPGVRSPECAGLRLRAFHPGALKRPNIGLHATRDTKDVIKHRLAGGRVMPGVGLLRLREEGQLVNNDIDGEGTS